MPGRSSEPSPFPPSHQPQAAVPAARRAVRTVLDDLAETVAAAYADERTRWMREQSVPDVKRFSPEKWMPAFRKLASQFVQNQIADYRTYLHVQFESRANKHLAPTPQQCYGPAAQQKWAMHARNREPVAHQLGLALKIQQSTFELAVVTEADRASETKPPWTQAEVVAAALSNPTYTLSALFRYGAARAAELPRVAASFHDAAYCQYLFAREAYDQVWQGMVPADLRIKADRAMLDLQALAGARDAK